MSAEDDLVHQLVVKGMLSKFGCSVDVADNGLIAQASVAQQAYDIIFMDCHTPVMDGLEATRRIRAKEAEHALPRTPIVALTAAALECDGEQCMASGMDHYMTKPVTVAHLGSALQLVALRA